MSLLRLPTRLKSRLQQSEWTAVTGAEGAFRFDSLPAGDYTFCAQVTNSAWLNPCEWRLPSPTVSLSNAQPNATVKIELKKGASVPIRIDDPGQRLSQYEGKTAGARLLLGVGSEDLVLHLAPVVSVDAGGRSHQIVIPFSTPLKFVLRSTFFRISDAAGRLLPRDQSTIIPLAVAPGQELPPLRFTVTGTDR